MFFKQRRGEEGGRRCFWKISSPTGSNYVKMAICLRRLKLKAAFLQYQGLMRCTGDFSKSDPDNISKHAQNIINIGNKDYFSIFMLPNNRNLSSPVYTVRNSYPIFQRSWKKQTDDESILFRLLGFGSLQCLYPKTFFKPSLR